MGLAAIGGGVGASGIGEIAAQGASWFGSGLGSGASAAINSSFGQGFIAGAAGNIASQGIGVATGLQHSFSWAGVAAAGVGGGASNWLASKVDLGKIGHAVADERGLGFSGTLETQIATGVAAGLRGAANALASAATRSAIDGTSFGDGIIAAIPDVIGQVYRQRDSELVSRATPWCTHRGA